MKPKTVARALPGPACNSPGPILPVNSPQIAQYIPVIDDDELLKDVVQKITSYIIQAVPDTAATYEQLRTTIAGSALQHLISNFAENVHHPAIVAAILIAKRFFTFVDSDDSGINESRGFACEIVAWQFLTYLSERELVDFLLYEIPDPTDVESHDAETGRVIWPHKQGNGRGDSNESTPLLLNEQSPTRRLSHPPGTQNPIAASNADEGGHGECNNDPEVDATEAFVGMNALEIAAVANAKKFLSQRVVQKTVADIWNGDVVFWDSLSTHSVKKPQLYNKRTTDPYTRLRVPKYQKAFQAAFFISFLVLYYAVLVERDPRHISKTEIFLYLWIGSFAYDEFGEVMDAGLLFYQTDFWSLWDVAIIVIGVAFLVTRVTGLLKDSDYVVDISFDILSLEALVLVPRLFSLMSLNSYFGSLIPVLKEMTKTFVKFLPVVVVLYIGFLTTFTMLARDRLSLYEMSWILVKVFFGSSYLGFDIARSISEVFGTPLMLIFVIMTNILLVTSLISLLSNSLAEVMAHAREEYLFQYSIYVLESSTSRRLTYFMPPLNLIALFFRPLRLFIPTETIRTIRILVLKVTHLPFVAIIWAYESSRQLVSRRVHSPPASTIPFSPTRPLSANRLSLTRDVSATAQASKSAISLAAHTPTKESRAKQSGDRQATTTASSSDITELINMVQRLHSQVEELTSMVAGQKKD